MGFWRFLTSRKTAVWLLALVVAALVLSSLLPSQMTMGPQEWARLRAERPAVFWLSERLSTPALVRHPVFLFVSAFLFFSTLLCTVQRLSRRLRLRRAEFDKERAFSFSLRRHVPEAPEALKGRFLAVLSRKGWRCSAGSQGGEGQKGVDAGFWGSVVFHVGILLCFLAAPISAKSTFRGKFLITEGIPLALKQGFVHHEGRPLETLPDTVVLVSELQGQYAQGRFEYYFGGKLWIGGQEHPFEVNRPVRYQGYQLSLHEFGHSPQVVIRRDGQVVFDYFLNIRNPGEGDYFDVASEGLRLFVMFFPDFYRQGNIVGTRSADLRNPVLMVKFLKDGEELYKGLIRLGGAEEVGPYQVGFPELRQWAGFVVVKEWGVPVLWAGFLVGVGGLFLRFASNERRMEFRVEPAPEGGSLLELRGYSRYYPAFLEREVQALAEEVLGEHP